MCFHNFEKKYYVADKPITCFKLMDRVGETPNGVLVNSVVYPRRMPYHVGDTISASSPSTPEAVNKLRNFNGEVVHSFSRDDISLYDEIAYLVLVRCEIPQGETYWKDGDQYASFSLVIKEVYDFKWSVEYETYFGEYVHANYPPTINLDEVRKDFLCQFEDGYNAKIFSMASGYEWYRIEKVPFGIYD